MQKKSSIERTNENDMDKEQRINSKLNETGERERLAEFLQQKLYECGWRAQVKSYCKDIVQQNGLDNITLEDLISDVTPKAKELVPDSVKRELLQRIKTFLVQQNDI